MSTRRDKEVLIWFHFVLLLLRAGTTDETSGGLPESESAGSPYVEVGPGHGSYRSR